MVYKSVLTVQTGVGVAVEHHLEQVVDDEDEAQAFGQLAAELTSAFMKGYGEADLSE